MEKKIARIFEDTTGYFWCDNEGPLDARGKAYATKAEAMRAAMADGYTHATGSGTYWDGVRAIPASLKQ